MRKYIGRIYLSVLIVCWAMHFVSYADEQPNQAETPAENAVNNQKKKPLVGYMKLSSPVDDVISGKVKNNALSLQHAATTENRDAILVLEITPGTSQFHHIQALVKFLTSVRISRVRTIAWVPETVTGHNVVLALACKEIIMHPDVSLGDIGRGQPIDELDKQFIRGIVSKRINSKVNVALVNGMLDKEAVVLKVKLKEKQAAEATESKIVTSAELDRLRKNRVAIADVETIKEAGEEGILSGSKARAHDVLVTQTASSLAELATLYKIPRSALRERSAVTLKPEVRLIELKNVIEPVLERFIERQILRAIEEGANTIVFEIDSPGGFYSTSKDLVTRILGLQHRKIKTVAFIPQQAYSGAALIALACDEIYLTPQATIGDIGMIVKEGDGAFRFAPAKMLSALREDLKNLAKEKDRSPALLEAMCDKDLNVYEVTNIQTGDKWFMTEAEIHASNGEWKKGVMVHETRDDNFLTINGERAHQLKIAEPPISDLSELKERMGIDPNVKLVAQQRTWIDTMIFVLNDPFIAGFLFFAAVILVYMEMHFTTGLFGCCAAICFALFFWSKYLGGTAGWLEVVLFMLGIVLVALEIFVFPGFGVSGVTGGLLIMASLIMASQTFGNLEPYADLKSFSRTMTTLGGSLIAVIVFAMMINRFLPNMPILNQIILTPPGYEPPAEGPRLRWQENISPVSSHSYAAKIKVGQQGTAHSVLRPAGKALLGNDLFDVVSNGPFIQRDSVIEVIEVQGNQIIVREIS